jgi:hypothetical protein
MVSDFVNLSKLVIAWNGNNLVAAGFSLRRTGWEPGPASYPPTSTGKETAINRFLVSR